MIREWRLHRDLTLEQVAPQVDLTPGSLSRIERGLQPYSQPLLEGLAGVLRCEPADLISKHPPTSPQFDLWQAVSRLNDGEAEQAARLLKAIKPAA